MSTTDRVFYLRGKPGPVHLLTDTYQAWCGVRPQFRHTTRDGTRDEVTCKACLRRMQAGRPGSRGARW